MTLDETQATALIDRIFGADRARDLPALLALLAPDVVLRIGGQPELHGTAAVGAAIGGLFGMVAGIEHSLVESWRGPSSLAWQASVTFTLPKGDSVTLPYANVARFAPDGLIAEYRIHADFGPLMAALA